MEDGRTRLFCLAMQRRRSRRRKIVAAGRCEEAIETRVVRRSHRIHRDRAGCAETSNGRSPNWPPPSVEFQGNAEIDGVVTSRPAWRGRARPTSPMPSAGSGPHHYRQSPQRATRGKESPGAARPASPLAPRHRLRIGSPGTGQTRTVRQTFLIFASSRARDPGQERNARAGLGIAITGDRLSKSAVPAARAEAPCRSGDRNTGPARLGDRLRRSGQGRCRAGKHTASCNLQRLARRAGATDHEPRP